MKDGMIVGHAIPEVNSGNYPLHSQETVLSQREIDKFKELTIVVRCKYCKYWHSNTEFCGKWSVNCCAHHTSPDWYCADGERKDGDGDG